MQSDRQAIDFTTASAKTMRVFLQQETIFFGSTFRDIKERRSNLKKMKNLSDHDKTRLNSVSDIIGKIRHAIHTAENHLSLKKEHSINDQAYVGPSLPPELIVKILSYLHYHELTPCLSVSKNIKAAAENTQIFSYYIYYPKVDIILKAHNPASPYPTYLDILTLRKNLSNETKSRLFNQLKHENKIHRIDCIELICEGNRVRKNNHHIALYCFVFSILGFSTGLLLATIGFFLFSDIMNDENRFTSPKFFYLLFGAMALMITLPIAFATIYGMKRSIQKQDDEAYYSLKNNLNSFFNKTILNESVNNRVLLEKIIIDSADIESETQTRQAPPSNTSSSSR